jgi:hypothetical protein
MVNLIAIIYPNKSNFMPISFLIFQIKKAITELKLSNRFSQKNKQTYY